MEIYDTKESDRFEDGPWWLYIERLQQQADAGDIVANRTLFDFFGDSENAHDSLPLQSATHDTLG